MDTILRDLISIQCGMLVTDSRAPSGMQAFPPSNNAANSAASCFYRHKLKVQQKRSEFANNSADIWQNKYYAPAPPTLITHTNPFTNNGGHGKPYSNDPSADHPAQSAETTAYPHNLQHGYNQHYSPDALTAANRQAAPNMFAWQQSLQHQQQHQLQQRLSHQPPAPHVSNQEDLLTNPPNSRFTDMFLRSQNPAGYLFSLNESQNSWCQPPNSSKDGLFQPQSTKNICPLCGKNYARPSTLKTHMRIHSGERPFHCKVCNKSFSQAANLTAHLRVHSGEKPFSCPVCHKTFSQSSSVTTHMRTHSGDRPYKCPVCRKGFSDSSTLTKHLRIHSGEKPYKCSYCSMSFSQSGNLNRHMKVHEQSHKPESAASSVSPLAHN